MSVMTSLYATISYKANYKKTINPMGSLKYFVLVYIRVVIVHLIMQG